VSRDSELDQNLSCDLQKIFSSDLSEIRYVGTGRSVMHDDMPHGRNQRQGQGHSREVDRQSPTGLILLYIVAQRINRYAQTKAIKKYNDLTKLYMYN